MNGRKIKKLKLRCMCAVDKVNLRCVWTIDKEVRAEDEYVWLINKRFRNMQRIDEEVKAEEYVEGK